MFSNFVVNKSQKKSKHFCLPKHFGIFLFFLAIGTGAGKCWAEIIPSDRRIDWSQTGVVQSNGVKGIPNRTTICATIDAETYGNGIIDATPAIQNALNNCPVDQAVFLPEGTYRIDSSIQIPSNVTLRGVGPQKTILDGHGSGSGLIRFGQDTSKWNPPLTAITGGIEKGSSEIIAASTSEITVGSYLTITQLNDPNFVTISGGGGNCTWCDEGFNGTRTLGQVVEVKSINGKNIGISPSLYITYQSSLSPSFWVSEAGAKYAGVEDLQVYMNDTGYTGNFHMNGSAYCWIKNIESNYTDGDHVQAYHAYRSEIRDSYFHDAFHHTPGSTDADVFIAGKSSGMLVVNNILRRLHASIMLNWGASGNVIAYNFTEGGFDQNAYNVLGGGIGMHGAHPMFNLFEGNVSENFHPDGIWGSSSHSTAFRNWWKGTTQICEPLVGRGALGSCHWAVQANRAVMLDFASRYTNLIGNVIGSDDLLNITHYNDGVNKLPMVPKIIAPEKRDYDSITYGYTFGYGGGGAADDGSWPGDNDSPYTTAMIHGDYNYADQSTTWDQNVSDHILPSSLFLFSKPSWFGNLAWPAIGSDVAGLNNDIPASYCNKRGLMPNCLEDQSNDTMVPNTPVGLEVK